MMRFSTILFLLLACTGPIFADDDNNYPFFSIALKSDESSRYILPANMGAPTASQTFNFALSMGTPYLSVAGTNCTTCNGVPAYYTNKSTTVEPTTGSAGFTLFGGGAAAGTIVNEDCYLPSENGSTWGYENQTVIVASNSSSLFGGSVSGIFGLQTGGTNSTLQNASVIGSIFNEYTTMAWFSYGLALQSPSADNAEAGVLHWAAADTEAFVGPAIMKNTSFINTITNSSSEASPTTVFELDGWETSVVGGNSVQSSSQNIQASLDPYYQAIYFPLDQANLIHATINGALSSSGDNGQSIVWTIPCGTEFSLSNNIGGTLFSMDQSRLIQKNSDGTCSSYIRSWTDPTVQLYLYGSSFISSIYLIVKVANPSSAVPDQFGFAVLVTSTPKKPVGAIIGGTIGGVAVLVLIVVGIYLIIRWSNQQKAAAIGNGTIGSSGYPPRPQSGESYMQKDIERLSSPPSASPISPNRAYFPT